MRGSRLAAAATFVLCLTAAVACQPPGASAAGGGGDAAAVVAWWSADRSPVVPFAAGEVARYLNRMSGVRVATRAATPGRRPPPRVAAAMVVLTGRAGADAARQNGPVAIDAAAATDLASGLGDAAGDAFAAASTGAGRTVLVAADPRGVLYAGYDLLQRLGVRFFAPELATYHGNAETVPRRPLSVPAYRTAQAAGMPARVKDLDESWSVSAAALEPLVDWMGKARVNVLAIPSDLEMAGLTSYDSWRSILAPLVAQRGIVIEVGQHGFENWLPPSRYPQFYVAGSTVFDVADDRAVTTYVDAVVAYLVARPEIGVFDAWPPDNATWPASAVRRYGSVPNAQAALIAKLTAALAARLPAVRVETIAYQATQEPPTAPYGYDPRRTIVDVAMGSRSYRQPMSGPANAPSAALIQRWRQAFAGELGAYEYYRRYAFRSLAFPMPDVIGGDLPWYRQAGVARIRSYSEPGDWITYELTHYEVAAMAWDPARDPSALLAGYLTDRFGAAADAVGRYLRDAEAAGANEFVQDGVSDQQRLDAAAAGYGAASSDLGEAAGTAGIPAPAAFLVERLRWNADFALADARLAASVAGGDVVTALQVRTTGAALLAEHRLDGILVDNPRYALQYWTDQRTAQDYTRQYRTGAAFVQPSGTVTVSPGATVRVQLTARAADLVAHRVAWTAAGGGGLTLSPASGTVDVGGGLAATVTIAIAAGRTGGRTHVAIRVGSGGDTWGAAGIDVVVAGPGDIAPYRDSVAVTADGAPVSPGFDGQGCGYSQQALAAGGVVSGAHVGAGGLTVDWPVTAGRPDNVVARGQQVILPERSRGSRLVILTAAAPGEARGAGWITYADASRSYYQLAVPDWRDGGTGPAGQARVVARAAYHACGRQTPGATYVYAIEVPVDQTRDVSSIVLPSTFGASALHVFGFTLG